MTVSVLSKEIIKEFHTSGKFSDGKNLMYQSIRNTLIFILILGQYLKTIYNSF